VRRNRESAFLIALNLGPGPRVINFSNKASEGRIVLSTYLDRSGESVTSDLHLRSDEGLLVRLTTLGGA
jgi:alpha-glucosidase